MLSADMQKKNARKTMANFILFGFSQVVILTYFHTSIPVSSHSTVTYKSLGDMACFCLKQAKTSEWKSKQFFQE